MTPDQLAVPAFAADRLPPVIAIVGSTATGKSALSLTLAQAYGGEVLNADSMQLYRGMDIGTGKLTQVDRLGVPHHLLDVLGVHQPATVAWYRDLARPLVASLRAQGVVPIVVGGSGLYLSGLLDNMDIPATDAAVRARWDAELTLRGSGELHAELARRDPAAAAAILASNGRRIVRALEVVELTGSFSATLPTQRRAAVPTVWIGLRHPRELLNQLIEVRVAHMLAAGWLAEVARLLDCGLLGSPTAGRAIGYSILVDLLGTGWDPAAPVPVEVSARIVAATRRYGRRQESWFGRDPRIHWLDAGNPELVQLIDDLLTSGAAQSGTQ